MNFHKDKEIKLLAAIQARDPQIRNLFKTLNSDDIYVFLLKADGLPYRIIGNALGVTRQRSRQIYCKALRKSFHPSRWRFLRD